MFIMYLYRVINSPSVVGGLRFKSREDTWGSLAQQICFYKKKKITVNSFVSVEIPVK